MKKKLFSIALTAVMAVTLCFGLTGCGGSGSEELGYDGEWVEAGILKAGLPAGWVNDETRQKADDETGEYELLFMSNEANDSSTINIFISAKRNPTVGESTGYKTIKEVAMNGVTDDDRDGAEFTTQEIGGLKYGRLDFVESISKLDEIRLFYKSGDAEKSNGDYDHEFTTCNIRVVGPFAEEQETVEQVIDSVRLDLGKEYSDEVKNGLEDELTADEPAGEIDLTGFTVEPPEGWNVKSSSETMLSVTNVDILNSDVKFSYKTQTQSAKEWIEDYNENYGGDNKIDTVDIGGMTFYRIKPADDLTLLTLDGKEKGTIVDIQLISCKVKEAEPVLKTIKFK